MSTPAIVALLLGALVGNTGPIQFQAADTNWRLWLISVARLGLVILYMRRRKALT